MSDTYLEALTSRFPTLERVIEQLHRDDPEFRSVCEEMEMAEMARARWKDMPDRAEEYGRILERLEKEFLDAVGLDNG
jgi:hypothetical protein